MTANASAAGSLEDEILAHIPLTRAMGVSVGRYTGDELGMSAPLEPNTNDKGCAFGGSIASLLTLSGWGLIELGLRAAGLVCDLYVGDSHLRYIAPVWDTLRATARFSEAGARAKLVAAVRSHGKGHAGVVCVLAGTGRPAAILNARYVAKLRQGP